MARARRILFVDHTATLGGGEISLFELVSELDRSRFDPVVVLCSNGPLEERLRRAGIETHTIPLSPSVTGIRKDTLHAHALLRIADELRLLAYVVRLAKFIRSKQIDIVHTNSLKADVIGGLAGRLAGVPVLWHIRDRIDPDYLPPLAVRLFRTLCGRIPAFIIANSDSTLQTVSDRCKGHCATIYSGIGYPRVEGHSHSGEQGAGPVIGIVGRIAEWKGQDVFLRAAALVHKQHPEARFRIIGGALFGEGGFEQQLHELCSGLGLGDRVEFTGFRGDVQEAIQELDMLVHASVVPEPFGRVVVEGMAAGKPVVATNGGGIREIVVDGKSGLLVPMGDHEAMAHAMSWLLGHPRNARRMARAARRRALRHFTARTTTRKVEQVYERLTAERAHKRRQPAHSTA